MIPSIPFIDTGATCDNTHQYEEMCPYDGSSAPDVVYAFTPAQDVAITADLCQSLYDTKLFIYAGAGAKRSRMRSGPAGSSGRGSQMRRAWWLVVLLPLLPACTKDRATDPGDRVPPAAVTDLAVDAVTPGLLTLTWTAPGDDGATGQADRYDLRYASVPVTPANWDSAHTMNRWPPKPAGQTEHRTVAIANGGRWYLGLRTADEELNWSALSNIAQAEVPPAIANFAVTDLLAETAGWDRLMLRWTAPGDSSGNATAYDLRYSETGITPETWEAATRVPGMRVPRTRGAGESRMVTGLVQGTTYFFALKASDARGRWSVLSNTASASTVVLASFTITDLSVVSTTPGSVTLQWTAPGDSAAGAVEYDLRSALSEITVDNWVDADRVPDLPTPSSPGRAETFTVTGLLPVVSYHFVLTALDVREHWSALSNGARGTTTLGSFTEERLTTSTQMFGARDGDWFPDGQSIVFCADWDDRMNPKLYRLWLDDLRTERLTSSRAEKPRLSPDGSKIAYVTQGYPGPELRVMSTTPGGGSVLVAAYGATEVIFRPSWSPDGRDLVYHVGWASIPTNPHTRIYRAPASGGTPILLVGEGIDGADPVWSPDGATIAYATSEPPGVWIMPAGGGTATLLANPGPYPQGLQWSRDGARIVFWTGNGDWIVSPTGENLTQLAFDRSVFPSSWSPDGRSLCVRRAAGGLGDLWVVRFQAR